MGLASTRGKRKRRRDETPPQTPPSSRPRYLNSGREKQECRYVPGLSSRERVELTLYQLYVQHRWTIKDFISHLVTEGRLGLNKLRSKP